MGIFADAYWEPSHAGLGVPRRHTRSGKFRTFTPSTLTDRNYHVSPQVAQQLSLADRDCVALDASLRSRGDDARAVLAILRLLEAIGSSAMEGYRSAAARLVASIATEGSGAKGSDIRIMGNLASIDAALALSGSRLLGPDDLVALQAPLMTPNEHALLGVRDEQNWVGGSDYHPLDASHVPPPPEVVPGLLADLVQYVSKPSAEPTLLRVALAHAQFETIHPFLDGNGRAGRALIHLMLRREGVLERAVLPISGTWGRDKSRYIAFLHALRTTGQRLPGDAVDSAGRYIAETVGDAVASAFAIADEVLTLQATTIAEVEGSFRSDSVAHQVVRACFQEIGVTTPWVAAAYGVNEMAAARALDRLESLEILGRRSAQRPHVFYSPALIRLIEKFAASLPEGDSNEAWEMPDRAIAALAARPPKSADRCGAWMPRSRAHCSLPVGHAGWPSRGHRQ